MMEKAFECQPYDADMEAGAVRFYVPRDFPLAGGVFEIRRVRTATAQDKKTFSDRPYPRDFCEHCGT